MIWHTSTRSLAETILSDRYDETFLHNTERDTRFLHRTFRFRVWLYDIKEEREHLTSYIGNRKVNSNDSIECYNENHLKIDIQYKYIFTFFKYVPAHKALIKHKI